MLVITQYVVWLHFRTVINNHCSWFQHLSKGIHYRWGFFAPGGQALDEIGEMVETGKVGGLSLGSEYPSHIHDPLGSNTLLGFASSQYFKME